MQQYKQDFIEFCLAQNILRFGEFTLKSGRISPYFFNAGLFNTGESLATLGGYYARAIHDSRIKFDVLFGPAYKGITLASATAIAIASMYEEPTPFAYNRKEAKNHGEGGVIVGSEISNKRLLLVDDVISAGVTTREILALVKQYHAEVVGIAIAMDREEIGTGNRSAIQEIQEDYRIKVCSVICLSDLIDYLKQDKNNKKHLEAMLEYQATYGVKK